MPILSDVLSQEASLAAVATNLAGSSTASDPSSAVLPNLERIENDLDLQYCRVGKFTAEGIDYGANFWIICMPSRAYSKNQSVSRHHSGIGGTNKARVVTAFQKPPRKWPAQGYLVHPKEKRFKLLKMLIAAPQHLGHLTWTQDMTANCKSDTITSSSFLLVLGTILIWFSAR